MGAYGLTSPASAQTQSPESGNSNSAVVQTSRSDASPSAAPVTSMTEIVVTGSRAGRVQARQSLSPIVVLPAQALVQTGATNLQDALERVLPSLTQPGFGGDTSNLIKAIRLRGLSPDQVLILVNGKRRHISGMLNLDVGPVEGSEPVDLDLIPVSAIDHIEVLLDGAAAQYGSDAIAGVINIILKTGDQGGSASATGGAYAAGDGWTESGAGDVGMKLGESGFLHLSASATNQGATNRSGPDYTVSPPADVNRILGTPRNDIEALGYNAGYKLADGINVYSFSTLSRRNATSYETHEVSDGLENGGIVNTSPIYPNGYIPEETVNEYDFSVTAGVKGPNLAGWNWDLSSTYGRDFDDFGITHSLNQSLGEASPTAFHLGDSIASQWTNNLDLSHPFNIGLAKPVVVAVGAEERYDTFQLKPGDPNSYILGAENPAGRPGSIGDFGVEPSVATSVHRNSASAYIDLSIPVTSKLRADVAGRYEHYSDFGSTKIGKVSARYDFTDRFALRATAQTGFRAPSLAQEDYALTQTGPQLYPGGPHLVQIQFPVTSAAAQALGATALKPETSQNYSFGFVSQPLPGLAITADAYQINIHDRITNSGFIFLGENPTGTEYDIGSYFTNAISTRNRGVDVTATYTTRFGDPWGLVRWNLDATYNKITIPRIGADPAALQALGQTLFDPEILANIKDSTPNTKVVLSADYVNGKWSVLARETALGAAYSYTTTDAVTYTYEHFSPHVLTDLEVTYQATEKIALTGGANNLFNTFPNRVNLADNGLALGIVYPQWSPISINGAYYYGRVAVKF